ncbi:hypothetical protein GCM10022286_01310 [Gryllotalpicola daejeonensis]|uniref:Lipoprotein n=1 Tax=Gryllotalpicola daejeonensis TaxID=993087 RepID=A0ABP7ZD70_9MICO
MRRTLPAFVLAAVTALALAGCAGSPAPSGTIGGSPEVQPITGAPTIVPATPSFTAETCPGVFVTVQFGLLGGDDVSACAKTGEPMTAAAALKQIGVSTEGTKKYGDQVVCRVNGEPSASKPIEVPGKAAYTETCAGMPAAFAYWAFWVRDSAAGKWSYATSGITTQQLKPGQTLGLKFTTGTDTTPPKG